MQTGCDCTMYVRTYKLYHAYICLIIFLRSMFNTILNYIEMQFEVNISHKLKWCNIKSVFILSVRSQLLHLIACHF